MCVFLKWSLLLSDPVFPLSYLLGSVGVGIGFRLVFFAFSKGSEFGAGVARKANKTE